MDIMEKNKIELRKVYVDSQPGDVVITYADTSFLADNFGYKPSTDLKDGIKKFVDWYRDYYS